MRNTVSNSLKQKGTKGHRILLQVYGKKAFVKVMLVTRSFDLIELFITIMLYGFAIFRAVSGAMTAGEVVAFVMYFSRIQYAVLGISDIIASILSRAPMWQQLFDFLDIPDEKYKGTIPTEKRDDNEIILKGSDIQRYGMTPSGNYIRFVPESFQQVASIEMYRAKEKLLYRFISEVPVFTYDDQQTLSLNSCNIVIPEIDGLGMKYVLAILNSSVAAYFVTKKFNSIKLLRSHIEQIPIPIVSKDIQVAIVKKVDRIMNSSENISGLYEDLDGDIMALYGLDVDQIETIQTALSGKNLFLKEN